MPALLYGLIKKIDNTKPLPEWISKHPSLNSMITTIRYKHSGINLIFNYSLCDSKVCFYILSILESEEHVLRGHDPERINVKEEENSWMEKIGEAADSLEWPYQEGDIGWWLI